MPTYNFPVNRGRFITDFLEAFNRQRLLGLQEDRAAREQERHELELTRARQTAEDELAARSLVPRYLGAADREGPYSVAALPSVPGGGAPLTPEQAGIESFAVRPPLPGVPGAEGTLRARTLRSVTEALGGSQNLATMLRSSAGREAWKLRPPITDEEFDRLQKRRQGWLEAQQHAERAQQFYEAGDFVRGRGAEAAAHRALYSAADPTKDDAGKYLDKIKQANEDIVKARKEGPDLDEDTARLAPLRSNALRHPDDPDAVATYAEAGSGAKTPMWQKRVDQDIGRLMNSLVRGAAQGKMDRDVAAINGEFLRLITEGRQATGEALAPEAAARLAIQNKPEAMPGFMRALREGKGTFPEFWSRALFGIAPVPKNDVETAYRAVLQGAPGRVAKQESEPGFWDAVGAKLGEMRRERTLSPAERTARLAKWKADTERTQALLEQTRTGKPAKPETINELSLAAQRYGKLAREWRDDFTAPKEEREEMAGRYHAMERQLLDRVEQLKRSAAPTGAEGEPTARGPKDRLASPPPMNPTRDDYLREKTRLLKAGHTPQSALAAMQQQGWQFANAPGR